MKKMIKLFCSLCLLTSSLLIAQPMDSEEGNYTDASFNDPSFNDASSINWLRSYSDAVSLSQSTSKPIVILFTGTTWCPACIKLERDVLSRPEFIQAVGQKFVFLKAEFSEYSEAGRMNSPYKPLLDRYNIKTFPTMVVVNTNGQQLHTVNYQNNGSANAYIQELLQSFAQSAGSNAGFNR